MEKDYESLAPGRVDSRLRLEGAVDPAGPALTRRRLFAVRVPHVYTSHQYPAAF